MKKITILAGIIFCFYLILTSSSCTNTEQVKKGDHDSIAVKPEDVIKRGEYLVGIMGCNDCHSPKRMGEKGPELIPELLLSGYPADRPIVTFDSKLIKEGFAMLYPDLTGAAGPWGVSFAANLTPDETGIGNWTEEQFRKALKEGKYKGMDGGRMLLPPMPWMNYINLSDADLHAMFQYFMSIKPVKNIVPQPISPDKM